MILITTIAGAAMAPALAAADLDKTVDFHIPAQPLDSALLEFSKQAHIQLAVNSRSVGKFAAPSVDGPLVASAALSELLRHSGLEYVTVGNTVTVSPMQPMSKSEDAVQTAAPTAPPAEESTPAPAHPTEPAEVVITGHYEFLSVDTSGTTNLPLPIEKVPQSISLVSSDFIKAADLKTLGEIAEYTPGATNVGNPENTGSAVQLRGFTAGRAIDGINVIQSNSLYEPDYAIFDRLELVKGPASVVYGVSSPGGAINFVTKSATSQTKDYLYVQGGSWNNYRIEGQVAHALDSDGKVRGIGVAVYDRGDSFMTDLFHRKTSLYGGINVDFTDTLKGYVHGGYERFVRPSFDGIPTEADGSPAPVPRSFFIGSKDIVITSNVYHAEGDLTWHANDMLDFSLKGNYQKANTFGAEDFSGGLGEDGSLSLEAHRFTDRADNYGVGASSILRFDDWGLKNSFVSFGALYQHSREPVVAQLDLVNYEDYGAGNIFDGQRSLAQTLQSLLTAPDVLPYTIVSEASTLTFSAQSVLQILDPLSVLLGVSHSIPHLTVTTNDVAQSLDAAGQTSYRAGVTYEFLPRTNAYFSFSQSFNLQPNIATGGAPLPPLTGNQYEVGIKARSPNQRLLVTGALYQIDEKNLGQYLETVGTFNYYKPADVRHRGLELQALGQITPEWQVNAGYSYLDPKIRQGLDPNTLSPISNQTEVFQPKQTASLYTTYSFKEGVLTGVSVGGGPRYVSDQRTAYDDSTRTIAGYTLVDATASYSIDRWLVQLNAHNLLNRRYFINNYQTLYYGNMVGQPFNFALSLRYEF